MLKILKMFRDSEDPEMGTVDGKAFELLLKAECLEVISGYGVALEGRVPGGYIQVRSKLARTVHDGEHRTFTRMFV